MCTYLTEQLAVTGSAKGDPGWARLARATVSFDHPVHAPFEHTLNIDLAPAGAPRSIAVELSAESARSLARTILAVLDSPEARLLA